MCWCVKLAGHRSESPKLLKAPSYDYYEGQTPFLTVLVRSSIAMTMSRHPSPKPLAYVRRKSFLLMSLKCRWSQNIVELVVPPIFFPRCEQGNCLRTTPSTILETTVNLEPHLGKHIPLEKVLWPSPSVPIVEPTESRHKTKKKHCEYHPQHTPPKELVLSEKMCSPRWKTCQEPLIPEIAMLMEEHSPNLVISCSNAVDAWSEREINT